MTRDDAGRVTVRAVRVPGGVSLDGRLDEAIYTTLEPVSGFIQQDPIEGVPAMDPTDVWLLFTSDTLYVSARCWSSDPDRLIANELRRDSSNILQNDNFAVVLDTFHDRRNGFIFHTNPVGALFDALMSDESRFNSDWSTVWRVRTSRFDRGWTVEMAIPFRSLRYRGSGPQVWGINFRRADRVNNTISFLTRVPRPWGPGGIAKLSLAATLVGLEIEQDARSLEVTPYVIGGLTTDRAATPEKVNEWSPDVGGDLKLGLTRGLTLDATVNTDFAQVEADEQQVNLTRFSIFFPEKRQFFLEGQGIFNFAGNDGSERDVPLIFFSRRIGLESGTAVPILAGARVTGRAGAYSIGALSIRQGEAEDGSTLPTTFSVARIRRDVGRRSSIGALFTHRSVSASGSGENLAAGVDATVWLSSNFTAVGYYAGTRNADGSSGASYRGKLDFNGDLWGIEADYLVVDATFQPEVGFVRRDDMKRSSGRLRYSPRPASIASIRSFNYQLRHSYLADTDWGIQSRVTNLIFEILFENTDTLRFRYAREFERVDEPFLLAETAVIAPGDYTANEGNLAYTFGPRRRLSGQLGVQHGSFFGGRRQELDANLRLEITPRVSVEPRVSINWLDLDFDPGRFRTTLGGARLSFAPSPRMLLSALFQYVSTSDTFASNVRFRWEFTPGSDLYIVYSDARDTEMGPALRSRSVVVKISKLVRF